MDVEVPDQLGTIPRPARRRLVGVTQWLHVYVSMASFVLLAFFAITGLTLNHADAFTRGRTRTQQGRGQLNPAWVRPDPSGGVARFEIAEHLRHQHALRGTVGEFRLDDAQCAVSFRGPGYSADVFVNRENGQYEFTETRLGAVAILNDLHKGRDTGPAWSFVIDLSAVLMSLVSLTGLGLLLLFRRRRVAGLAAGLLGGLATAFVYLAWVR